MSKKIREMFDQVEAGMPERCAIPDDIPLTELADMVIRGKVKLSSAQMRMLIEMLPFVAPKLSAIGYVREMDTFAARLDRAIQRSNTVRHQPKLIEDSRFKRGDDPRE